MPITVAMIEEKEFKTKMRGYDPVEVDEFLDEICDEMVAMQEEIAALQSRLSQAPRAAAPYAPVPAPVPAPAPVAPVAPDPKTEESSEAAQRLLARAQKVYDETVAEAKAEAEKILKGASARVNSGLEDLEEEKAALEKEVAMLKDAARDYRTRFIRLVEDQKHILHTEEALFE